MTPNWNREFKAPTDEKKYTIDWSNDLGAETISSDVWTIDSGLTDDGQTNDTTTSTIDVSGGTAGYTYKLSCAITTSTADVHVKEIYIRVQNHLAG